MNRSVLARQMFAKGGAAFPDLNKDGEITQADILMGRGVELKQEGGIAGMMPADMAPPPAAPAPGMEGMGNRAMDPQIIQDALSAAQQEIGNLDNAEDYETVMNSIRGDDATVEERYAELAEVVGEEDAAQTPESVLTLVQPAMAMAAVDQGIGGLAQQEMTEPVQGAMAQGIMSSVTPPAPEPAPMPPAGMGGPPPANFKDGGLVRRGDNQPVQKFQFGGTDYLTLLNATPETRFQGELSQGRDILRDNTINNINQARAEAAARAALSPAAAAALPTPKPSYDERVLAAAKGAEARYTAAGLGTAAERAAELEEQKKLTQAQMLFDVAQAALTFAAPMQGERPGMSPAERLAMAASTTQLPQTIGARAQQQLEAKRAADKEERALKLAAVQRGETQVDTEIAAEEARRLARIKKTPTKADYVTAVAEDGTSLGSFRADVPEELAAFEKVLDENPGSYEGTPSKPPKQTSDIQIIYNNSDKEVGGIKPYGYSKTYDLNDKNEREAFDKALLAGKGALVPSNLPSAPTPDKPISERDFFMKFGFSYKAFGELSPDDQAYVRGLPVVTKKDFFVKFGMLPDQFKGLSESDQRFKLGLPTITDNDYFAKFGMNKEKFLAQPVEIQNRMLGIEVKPVVTKNALGQVVTINPVDGTFKMVIDTVTPDIRPNATGQLYDYSQTPPKLIDSAKDPRAPKPYKVVIDGKEQYVDANSPEWPKVQERINKALEENPGSAVVTNISTEVKPMGFMVTDDDGKTKMVLSYDNGRTYNDTDGNPQKIPQGSIMVSPETTYQVYTAERSRSLAGDELTKFDAEITQNLVGQEGITVEDLTGVKDALAMARKGTGFYANFTALLDGASSLIPPAIKPDWVTIFGRETQQARQYLRGVRVLGRSALVVNNKFPVAEMATVAELFPDPDAWLRDPDTESLKFVDLKRAATQQYRRNLKELQKPGLDKKVAESIRANNFEIQRLLSLLPGVQLGAAQTVDDEAAISEAQDIMSGAVKRATEGSN